jgi:DNA processing protein
MTTDTAAGPLPVEPRNLLLLHALPGVGKRKLLDLVQRAAFLLAEPVDRNFWLFVQRELGAAFSRSEQRSLERQADTILGRAARGEFALLHWFDAAYPELLRHIYDPPLALFCRGHSGLLGDDGVAVVGARHASDYGVAVAQEFAGRLAALGLVVVSGLALGIDSAAHVGALRAEGRTIAVLGCGIDIVYPKQAAALHRQIAERGCLVTEFPPGLYPSPQNFPIRNRIISGLCLGTLIVEATHKSGSLITARLALEQGRELFAVPGPVHSPLSVGPNYLIKQGAKLVQVWPDVLEELPSRVRDRLLPAAATAPAAERALAGTGENLCLTNEEEAVYKHVPFDRKVHLDDLLLGTGLSMGKLGAALLQLQFRNLIQELPGQYYIRMVR